MRLLSIGRPLRHRAADNHSITNAPALFDYDLIALDPAGILHQVGEVLDGSVAHHTATGLPVLNGSTTAGVLGLGELLRRRREELHRAVEHGAVVVIFTHPPAAEREVIGLPGFDRYFLIPAPSSLAWDASLLRWGEGTNGRLSDPTHPFARAFEAIRPTLRYRAYFDERATGFAGAARVFARSTGGAAIAVHFPMGAGHLVFLPTPAETGGDPAAAQASAILEAAQELLQRAAEAEPQGWSRQYVVPGLAEREAERAQAEAASQEAAERLGAARAAEAERRTLRNLVLGSGRHTLIPAIEQALRSLGFIPRPDDSDPGPVMRTGDGARLYVEAEGDDGAVGMSPHYRLRARLDAVIEREGKAPRGLLVVNGHSRHDPATRAQQYSEPLRVAAESTRYAIVTGHELFAAACYALGSPEQVRLEQIRSRLIETDGVVSLADLLST